MKALVLSSEDWQKRGGSELTVYTNMIAALARGGITAEHKFVSTTQKLLEDIDSFGAQIVYSGAYHTFDSDGVKNNVHGILDARNIPYVGSDESTLELVLNKPAAKQAWRNAGILTPSFFNLFGGEEFHESHFPLLIKPSNEGSSRGIDARCVVYNNEQLTDVVDELRSEGFEDLFAETYLGTGRREFTVGVIGGEHKLVGPSEMINNIDGEISLVITSEMKEGEQGTRLFEPDPVPPGLLRDAVISVASRMYAVAGMQDYGRCDVIMGEDKKLYAIEINGQSVIESYFLTGMRGLDIGYDAAINGLFLSAISRNIKQGRELEIPSDMKQVIPPHAYEQLTR